MLGNHLKHCQQALRNNVLLLFNVFSRHCILRQFDKPTSAWILYAARDGQLSSAPAASLQQGENEDWRRRRQTGQFPVRDPQSDGVLLKSPQVKTLNTLSCSELDVRPGDVHWATPALTLISISPRLFDTPSFFSQTEITFTPREPLTGRYVVVVHYHQPEHPSFPVEVRVNAGREWKGKCGREWQAYSCHMK